MNNPKRKICILIADDDPDDRMLIEDAFKELQAENKLVFVEDGEQLLSHLRREGDWKRLENQPLPGLVLLDLNMPKMDGREALRQIKADDELRAIPVVILTTSRDEEDILRTYASGVNSFISKPVTFDGLVEVVRVILSYWIEIAELPPPTSRSVGAS